MGHGKVDLSGLDWIPEPQQPTKAFHVLTVKNKRGKTLKKIIDTGIDQLSQDGTKSKILKGYIGEEF